MCKKLVGKGQLTRPHIIFNRTAQRAMDLQATLPANKSNVAGSIPAAVTGADIIFTCLGDDAAMMETVDTICVTGRANIDYRDQPCGRATLLKVIGNSFILNMVETLSEGHTIAEKSGLGNDNLHQVIEAMFLGPPTAYSGRMIGGDYYRRAEPLFGS
ncbi:MAG: hypothetical protein Q9197_004131 [Variospora fuerteventurae]